MPTPDNSLSSEYIAKTIAVFEKLAMSFPKDTTKEAIRTVSNAVHHSSPQVREQAANFMLSVCSDFDNNTSLFEIQKMSPDDQDTGINFSLEPHKSKKQLVKLLELVQQHVSTKNEYA
jgi:hypothetical protein